jgi:hypothetical protein
MKGGLTDVESETTVLHWLYYDLYHTSTTAGEQLDSGFKPLFTPEALDGSREPVCPTV